MTAAEHSTGVSAHEPARIDPAKGARPQGNALRAQLAGDYADNGGGE